MTEPTNTSFIPKRGPVQKENRPGRRKVYVGTIIIRILFFAAVVAAGSVYVYERKLDSNLDTEIFTLNNDISKFNEVEMSRVLAFDSRLNEVKYRLDHAASVVALLQAIERSTVDAVQITNLTLERQDDKNYTAEVDLKTPSFDIALFQREILQKTDTLLVSSISDLNLANIPPSDPLFTSGEELADEVTVSFRAALTVDVDKIPHTANVSEMSTLDSTGEIDNIDILDVVDEQPALGAEVLEVSTNLNEI